MRNLEVIRRDERRSMYEFSASFTSPQFDVWKLWCGNQFLMCRYIWTTSHIYLEHKIGNVWEATMCNLLQSIYRFLSCVVPNENSLRMSSISLRKFPSRCWTHFIDSWIIQFVRWKAQIYVASWVNRNEYKPSLPVIPFVCRCH